MQKVLCFKGWGVKRRMIPSSNKSLSLRGQTGGPRMLVLSFSDHIRAFYVPFWMSTERAPPKVMSQKVALHHWQQTLQGRFSLSSQVESRIIATCTGENVGSFRDVVYLRPSYFFKRRCFKWSGNWKIYLFLIGCKSFQVWKHYLLPFSGFHFKNWKKLIFSSSIGL